MRHQCNRPSWLATVAVLAACGGGRAAAPAPTPAAATEGRGVAVVTLNIWHDQEDWPARLDYIAATLRELSPDLIGLQEVLQNPELPNQAEALATRLGYTWYFASVDTAGSPKRYGNAILTRHPVLREGFRKLAPLNDYRTAAHVRVRLGADSVDVYVTHLHHTETGGAIRRTQLLDLLDFMAATRGHGPAILLGDFNAPVTEPEMTALSGRFSDAFGRFHGTTGQVTTLNPAKGHRPVRIDHIFYAHGNTRALRPIGAEIILDHQNAAGIWASDHFGVLARFELTGW